MRLYITCIWFSVGVYISECVLLTFPFSFSGMCKTVVEPPLAEVMYHGEIWGKCSWRFSLVSSCRSSVVVVLQVFLLCLSLEMLFHYQKMIYVVFFVEICIMQGYWNLHLHLLEMILILVCLHFCSWWDKSSGSLRETLRVPLNISFVGWLDVELRAGYNNVCYNVIHNSLAYLSSYQYESLL